MPGASTSHCGLTEISLVPGSNATRWLPRELCRHDLSGRARFFPQRMRGETGFIKFKIVPVGGDVTLTEKEASRYPDGQRERPRSPAAFAREWQY